MVEHSAHKEQHFTASNLPFQQGRCFSTTLRHRFASIASLMTSALRLRSKYFETRNKFLDLVSRGSNLTALTPTNTLRIRLVPHLVSAKIAIAQQQAVARDRYDALVHKDLHVIGKHIQFVGNLAANEANRLVAVSFDGESRLDRLRSDI